MEFIASIKGENMKKTLFVVLIVVLPVFIFSENNAEESLALIHDAYESYKDNKIDEALDYFQQADKIMPDRQIEAFMTKLKKGEQPDSNEEKSMMFIHEGYENYTQKDYVKALDYFRRAERLIPDKQIRAFIAEIRKDEYASAAGSNSTAAELKQSSDTAPSENTSKVMASVFGDYTTGCNDGAIKGNIDVNAVGWSIAGIFLGPIGILLGLVIEPQVPPEYLMGKSADYVTGFTNCYKNSAKTQQWEDACAGCAGVLLGLTINYILHGLGL